MWHGLPAHENTATVDPGHCPGLTKLVLSMVEDDAGPVPAKPQAKPDWLCFGFVFDSAKRRLFDIFFLFQRAYVDLVVLKIGFVLHKKVDL